MLTRNRARTVLAELQQQQQQVQPAITLVKPLQSQDPESASDLQSVEGLAIVAKKMNVISLDSSSEEHDAALAERDTIDLSESSKSVMDISSSDDDDESSISEDEDEDVDGDESENSEDENHGKRRPSSSTIAGESFAAEVAKLIKGGDPKKLKVDDCRAYLRNYGLRITGTKPVLIDRIKQHIELKEGGSRSYDRSTFTMNCTGDVCKGDVVMFAQKVYNKYSESTKGATQAGTRTVAGRVVKESYGAQRQQHTFTVEVLWSTGYRPLAPMKCLLVKGRNLYKRRTLRQKWADEGERDRSLAEKHERGDAARQVRAMKQGRLRGYVGRFGAEGQSMKQLVNPYTNTLAYKENINYAIGFQSAVSGPQSAEVRTQHHMMHRHTSYVSTGANTVPLGKVRQFGQPSGNGEINLASGGGPKSTGANTVPHGEIPRYGQPSESQEFSRAAGGASTSVNKDRQWFKPTPVPCPSQQACEAQNVATSSAEGSSRLQSGPCALRQSVTVQAPIISDFSQRAGSTGIQTQSHDGRSASSLNRPPSPLLSRPTSRFSNRPSSLYQSRPSSPYQSRPSSPYQSRPSSPYHVRPPSPYHARPSSPYQGRPSSPYHGRPSSPYQGRSSAPYHGRPSSPYQGRPSSPYHGRPSSPFLNQPASYPIRPSSPYQNRPTSPFSSRLSSSNTSRPLSPLPSRPNDPLANRAGLFGSAPSSPLPNDPLANRAGLFGSAPSSPLPNRPASPYLRAPSVRVSQDFEQRYHNQSLLVGDTNPTGSRRPEQSPPVSGNDLAKTGFPCPTQSCTYRGSRLCSSGVCYYCCKKIGRACRNPKHRPQAF